MQLEIRSREESKSSLPVGSRYCAERGSQVSRCEALLLQPVLSLNTPESPILLLFTSSSCDYHQYIVLCLIVSDSSETRISMESLTRSSDHRENIIRFINGRHREMEMNTHIHGEAWSGAGELGIASLGLDLEAGAEG